MPAYINENLDCKQIIIAVDVISIVNIKVLLIKNLL
jgi:hypothetical protein